MEKKKSSGKHEEKPKEPSEYKIKTMVDGDFRFPSKLRERIGFGNHVELKVTVLHLDRGKTVTLEISRADWG